VRHRRSFEISQNAIRRPATLRAMKKFLPWLFAVAFLFWLGSTMA
jgi:hypothetical protein